MNKEPKIKIKDSVFTNLFADKKYRTAPIAIPKPEMYVVYTGERTFRKIGRTNEAVHTLINECKQKDILREYLTSKESEVFTIMTTLFDQDKITESYGRDKYNIGRSEGEILGSVETMREFNVPDIEIMDKIIKRYNLTQEKAQFYLSESTGKYNEKK